MIFSVQKKSSNIPFKGIEREGPSLDESGDWLEGERERERERERPDGFIRKSKTQL